MSIPMSVAARSPFDWEAEPLDFRFSGRAGPITRSRHRRTILVHLLLCLVGLGPLLLGWNGFWQAAGLGLWLPGAGFIAAGGWWVLLFPVFVALFGVAFFAWFGSGMVVAPAAVWLGGAALAGAAAGGGAIWSLSAYVVPALTVMVYAGFHLRAAKKTAKQLVTAEDKKAMLPASLRDVAADVRRTEADPPEKRELTEEQLAAVRYLFDRALQPINQLGGFDHKDIFQTAAIRYQINFLGYALAHLQALYTPSFHGYLSEAQQRLIDQYLDRKIWGYWIYETMWGHLNFKNFDPAGIDNIMLTGYFGGQVALYQGNTGDTRYADAGGLTFRLNEKTAFRHDVHSIHRSIVDNMRRNQYCLYPCEPNWIYPACNFRGMWSLAIYDRVFGTAYVDEFLENWLDKLDTEFTDAAGTVVPLRSRLTGFALPFLADDVLYAPMGNGFIPKRAARYWAVGRANWHKRLTMEDGLPILDVPDTGMDAGNYQVGGRTMFVAMALEGAKEFGDTELAEAAINTLDLKCERRSDRGTVRYLRGSNLTNINIVKARLTQCGDNHALVKRGPPEATFRGPLLTGATYPEVLVARAISDGTGLDLTLYPGTLPAKRTIEISRLVPNGHYSVTGATSPFFRADAAGAASIEVNLRDRTEVAIRPSAD